ncbi:MAG: ribonuclease P protein component [Desulfobacteraceae bacterium]|nr:ribonuclease P protein component [Desulfobacteraceae bacterium]
MELQAKHRGYSFSDADRLLKRHQFVYLADHGKKVQNQYFVGFFESSRVERCRLGITVSRRVGKAVTRNRIKRVVREYFRINRSIFKHLWDIHLIAKKEAAACNTRSTMMALEQIFKRIESTANG